MLSPDRRAHPDYNRLFKFFKVQDLDRDLACELAIFLATPGILPEHFPIWFDWGSRMTKRAHFVRDWFGDRLDLTKLASENAATITIHDGLEMLKLLVSVRPKWSGPVPWWSQLALQEMLGRGVAVERIGEKVGVGADRVRKWRDQLVWDPVSLLAY